MVAVASEWSALFPLRGKLAWPIPSHSSLSLPLRRTCALACAPRAPDIPVLDAAGLSHMRCAADGGRGTMCAAHCARAHLLLCDCTRSLPIHIAIGAAAAAATPRTLRTGTAWTKGPSVERARERAATCRHLRICSLCSLTCRHHRYCEDSANGHTMFHERCRTKGMANATH